MRDNGIVNEINNFLNKTGMGKVELSTRLGCPHCTVSRWLNNHCAVSPAWAFRIKEFIKTYKPSRVTAKK